MCARVAWLALLRGPSTSPLAVQPLNRTASINVSPTEYLRLSEFQRFPSVLSGQFTYCATVDASVASFACRHYCFGFEDLPGFIRKLREAFVAVKGTVALRTERETDTLIFRFNETRGHVLLSGDFGRSHYPIGTGSLKFDFEFDQTYLDPFLVELESISGALHG